MGRRNTKKTTMCQKWKPGSGFLFLLWYALCPLFMLQPNTCCSIRDIEYTNKKQLCDLQFKWQQSLCNPWWIKTVLIHCCNALTPKIQKEKTIIVIIIAIIIAVTTTIIIMKIKSWKTPQTHCSQEKRTYSFTSFTVGIQQVKVANGGHSS